MTQPTIAIPLPEPEDDPPEERNHNPYIVAAILALSIVVLLFYRLSGSQVVPDEQTNMAALQNHSKSNHIFVDVDGAVVRPGVYRLRVGSRVFDAIASAGGLKGDADRLQIKMAAKLHDEEKLIVPRIGQVLPTPTATPKTHSKGEEDLPPEVGDNPEIPPDEPLPELTPPVEVPPAASPSPVAASTVPPPPPVDTHPPAGATPAVAASPAPRPEIPAANKISINRASADQLQNIPGVDAKLALDIVNYRKGPPPHAFTSLEDLTSVPGLKGPKFDEIQPYLKL
ncbi:MAG: helix-hairpin-helix domain-containing protein [Candidatus Eremiobacteraeota bacterium]|nr:helix-hairpin-helix domain-containing protein [Candidatus Eremiobacteraeota bacterium]MCW5870456.1 helix-hairpin-helix domain-containing protein [Candidatus Eremiobacteraeota bacterium]